MGHPPKPETYYRVWGTPAKLTGRLGTFYSLTEPLGSEDAFRDQYSLSPKWNSMQNRTAVTIPAGATVYVGPAAAHPELGYGGGGIQVWVANH
jgi:hypothetical protein